MLGLVEHVGHLQAGQVVVASQKVGEDEAADRAAGDRHDRPGLDARRHHEAGDEDDLHEAAEADDDGEVVAQDAEEADDGDAGHHRRHRYQDDECHL